MAGNTKQLRTRIKSVSSTGQLTKAMELVAASKISRAAERSKNSKDYREALIKTVSILTADNECLKSPFMTSREGAKTKLIVIAGDRGLAGGYNSSVFKTAAPFFGAEIIPIGKKACEKFKKEIISSEKFQFADAFSLAEKLVSEFKEGNYNRLGIVTTEYLNIITQEPVVEWVLPLKPGKRKNFSGVIFEPDMRTVLEGMVTEYVAGMIFAAVRESFLCEVSARRTAMDSAGKNARKMISELQLQYNRARQGAITQEITEIVAGSGE